MRDDFTAKTINILSRRASFRCSNPQCRKLTVGPNNDKNKATLIGVAAHISAASPGGPRYESYLTTAQRTDIENGIWLCENCASLIDKDEKKFTKEILLDWRRGIEEEASYELVTSINNSSILEIRKESLPQQETLTERTNRIKEERAKKQSREDYFTSAEAIRNARSELKSILEKLNQLRIDIEDPTTNLHLGFMARPNEMYGFGHENFYLCFNWCRPYENDVKQAILRVSFLERDGHYGIDYNEKTLLMQDYKHDLDEQGSYGWTDFATGENFRTSDELINMWVNNFLDKIEKKKK